MPSLPLFQRSTSAFATAVLFVAVPLLAQGCDPAVDVFRPTEQYRFSLFGALDVAADTQAIRVAPIDDTTAIGAPPDLKVTVFLKNLDTGEQVFLRDSLTTLASGQRTIQVHNFWTTHPIHPATSYRVIVQRKDETVTTATTTTPARSPTLSHNDAFLLPCLFPRYFDQDERRAENTFLVEARNVEHIAAADVTYFVTYRTPEDSLRISRTFSHYSTVEDKGAYFEIPFFYRPDLVDLNPDPGPEPECVRRNELTHPYALVRVASGGPNWPEDWRGLPIDEIATRNAYSNVEGGHGFVAGVYSDSIKVPVEQRPP